MFSKKDDVACLHKDPLVVTLRVSSCDVCVYWLTLEIQWIYYFYPPFMHWGPRGECHKEENTLGTINLPIMVK